jgi:hypothetical protein
VEPLQMKHYRLLFLYGDGGGVGCVRDSIGLLTLKHDFPKEQQVLGVHHRVALDEQHLRLLLAQLLLLRTWLRPEVLYGLTQSSLARVLANLFDTGSIGR